MQTHIVTHTAIFDGDGRLLTLRRSADDAHRPGGFDLPGGKVEEGEDIFAGAVRETAEESGLQLDAKNLQLVFASCKVGYQTEVKTDINFIHLGFIAKLPPGQTVRLSHEHQSFDWLTFDEALADCDGAPTQKAFLEHLRAHDLARDLMP
jgi:8-oxo-dGTP pyrophosphatase MutT (NUDIX family)